MNLIAEEIVAGAREAATSEHEDRAVTTDDFRAGIQSFLEKREPKFEGN